MRHVSGDARASRLVAMVGTLVAGVLLAVPLPPTGPVPRGEPVTPSSLAPPRLIVNPDRWWMPAGNSTSLAAAWVGESPGCTLSALWFRWTTLGQAPVGSLNSTVFENVSFDADSGVTGTETVRVISAAVQECNSASNTTVGTADANLTVLAPLAVSNLSTNPNPIEIGGLAWLEGSVSGGEAPYSLLVLWGDGSESNASLSNPGAFRLPHEFPAGEFRPAVWVSDSSGLVATGTVDSPLTASDSLAVGISTDATAVDVGVPMAFTANVLDEPNGSSTGWSCSSPAPPSETPSIASMNFSCAFSQVGTGSVLFEVFPPVPVPTAFATLSVNVAARPQLNATSSAEAGEEGQPCSIRFDVAGGVPPFRVAWSAVGSAAAGSLSVPVDGPFLVSFVPALPGSLQVIGRVTDADGISTANATTNLVVDPPLNLTLAASRSLTATNSTVALVGSLGSGAPPFLWVVVPEVAPVAESPAAGQLASVGTFAWQGSYAIEGNVTGTAIVVDADGALCSAPFHVLALPLLTAHLAVIPGGPRAPGRFGLSLDLVGGLPPFRVVVTAPGGIAWNFSDPSDGNESWSLAVDAGGLLVVSVRVVDALGYWWNATRPVPVASPAPAPTATPAPSGGDDLPTLGGLVVGLALALTAGTLGLLRRSRRGARAVRPVDPVAVLRAIIEPAEGADRSMVELLADEAGVPLADAHAAIDRLIAEGTLRSEKDPEGGEILAWSVPP